MPTKTAQQPVTDDAVVARLSAQFPRDEGTAWRYADGSSGLGMERIRKSDGQVQRWNGSKWANVGEPYGRFTPLTATGTQPRRHALPVKPKVSVQGMKPTMTVLDEGAEMMTDERKATSSYTDKDEATGTEITVFTVANGQLGLGVVEVIDLPNGRDVWLDEQTLERIEANPKLYEQFDRDSREWVSGMKYLVEDVSYTSFFKDAIARKAAEAAPVRVVDSLEDLQRKVNALLVQAAQYNSSPSARMAETFGMRLGELSAELESAEARIAEVRESFGLASVAVMEALS